MKERFLGDVCLVSFDQTHQVLMSYHLRLWGLEVNEDSYFVFPEVFPLADTASDYHAHQEPLPRELQKKGRPDSRVCPREAISNQESMLQTDLSL